MAPTRTSYTLQAIINISWSKEGINQWMAALNADFESKQQKSRICTLYSNHLYSPQKLLLLVPINSGKKMQIKADYLNELLCSKLQIDFWVLEIKIIKRFQTIIIVGTLSIKNTAFKRQTTYRHTATCHFLFNNNLSERERKMGKGNS